MSSDGEITTLNMVSEFDFIGFGYLKLREFCRLKETLQAKIVLFPGYLNDKYVFCKSYSRIQLKLVVIYSLLNL